MEGLTFEESIIRLIQMFVFEKRDIIKQRVIEEYKNYPLSHLFGENIVNERGQTTFALQPLDIRNLEGDTELLELHMHQNALKNQRIVGDIWIKNIFLQNQTLLNGFLKKFFAFMIHLIKIKKMMKTIIQTSRSRKPQTI